MKTKILLLFLFFPLCLLYSQIVYDFSSGDFENKELIVKRGEPVSLKIKNINPFFYEIVIKREDKEIAFQNTDIEAAKKTLDEIQQNNYYKIQENFVFEESYVTLFSSGEKSTSDNMKSVQTNNYKLDILNLEIKKLENDIYNLMEKIKANELSKIPDYEKSNEKLQKNIEINEGLLYTAKKEFLKLEYETKKIINESNDIDLIKSNIDKRIEGLNVAYLKFIEVSREIIKLNQNYNNYIDKVISPELNSCMYRSILLNQKKDILHLDDEERKKCNYSKDEKFPNEIETTYFLNKKNIDQAYSDFRLYADSYQKVIAKVNECISFLNYQNLNTSKENDVLKAVIIKDIERIQKSIKVIDDVIQKINLSKKLNEVEILDRLLRKPETFEYVSAPIQGEEDYLEFDVVIKSKRNLSNTYHINNDKSFKYFKYITGGIRFDFSVGTVFDFGTIDKKYTLDAESKIQRLDNNKYNPTIAGIFHASFRNSKSVAFGFSLGASFTTGLSFNSIFPGVSLLMGKRNKIILTAGPSFRLVDELKSNYKEGMTLNNSLADSDLLTKNFRIGGFFGISYNLTPKQKDVLKLK